jgi:hypothetical protein
MTLPRLLEALRRRATGDAAPAGDEAAPSGNSSELLSAAPLVLGSALIAATLVLAFLRFTTVAAPPVVVFDIIKYTNAQRAVASRFLGGKNSEEVAPILLAVSKKTRDTIASVAGPGTLVMIRQAVVQGEARDITDEVLKRLGLPTDVPTADPTHRALDIAPTMLGHDPTYSPDPVTRDDIKAKQSAGLP